MRFVALTLSGPASNVILYNVNRVGCSVDWFAMSSHVGACTCCNCRSISLYVSCPHAEVTVSMSHTARSIHTSPMYVLACLANTKPKLEGLSWAWNQPEGLSWAWKVN